MLLKQSISLTVGVCYWVRLTTTSLWTFCRGLQSVSLLLPSPPPSSLNPAARGTPCKPEVSPGPLCIPGNGPLGRIKAETLTPLTLYCRTPGARHPACGPQPLWPSPVEYDLPVACSSAHPSLLAHEPMWQRLRLSSTLRAPERPPHENGFKE